MKLAAWKYFSVIMALVLALGTGVTVFNAAPAQAATLNVPVPYATIQAAIDAAVTGDTINVAAGTYNEKLIITGKNITIIGAGELPDTANTTRLSGTGVSGRMISIGTGLDVHISKIFIDGDDQTYSGLTVSDSEVTLEQCIFWYCGLNANGGGLYAEGSNVTLNRCTFNEADGNYGGGLYVIDSAVIMNDCYFKYCGTNSGRGGGAICLDGSELIAQRCSFSNNEAPDGNGGGIHLMTTADNCSANLSNCTFSGNSAAEGGAISAISDVAFADNVTLTNCTFYENGADSGCSLYQTANITVGPPPTPPH